MVNKIKCRVFGYCVILVLQLINTVLFIQALLTPKSQEVETILSMRWRFITVWNLFIQGAYAVIGLICDVPLLLKMEGKHDLLDLLRWYRGILFTGLFFPCGFVVFTVFWPIFIFNRELIFPAVIDTALSPISNHIMHSAIFPIILWEYIFAERKASVTNKLAKYHMIAVVAAYNVMLFVSYYQNGDWPYPIMTKVYGTIYFPILYISITGHCVVSYYVQSSLQSLLKFNQETCQKVK